MARLLFFVFVPAILTAVFGYPSAVPSVQGYLTQGRDADETPDRPRAQHEESDLIAAASTKWSHPLTGGDSKSHPTDDANLRPGPLPVALPNGKGKPNEEALSDSDDDNDDSDMFMEPQETDEEVVKVGDEDEAAKEVSSPDRPKDNNGMGQHFFPSFAPVFSLGHSRPPQLFHHENYYSKSRNPPPPLGPDYSPFRAYRESSYKVPITIDDDPTSSNILGSGNFGVLKGGTYYNDEDRGELGGLFNPYYNNGHGRPYSANPRPQKYSNGDFFANFRDFADINTPNKGSFSEYVIVYVNKNASKADEGMQVLPPGKGARPKNIIEQLSMLDNYPSSNESEAPIPEKKASLHKRKLALFNQEKANKDMKSQYKKKEPLEPLLALS